jgi:NhaP-type Na+/H+ or K+/H+ antiporter
MAACSLLSLASARDGESFLLLPTAISLLLIGIRGTLTTDDLLVRFTAGCALNWNKPYLEDPEKRHDEVNNCVDVLLNFGGFMFIGTSIPGSQFQISDITGITVGQNIPPRNDILMLLQ